MEQAILRQAALGGSRAIVPGEDDPLAFDGYARGPAARRSGACRCNLLCIDRRSALAARTE